MMRIDSSWSALPQLPNIIAPRQSGLTFTPVRPRVLWSMCETYRRPRTGRRREGSAGRSDRDVAGARGRADHAWRRRILSQPLVGHVTRAGGRAHAVDG